MTQVPFILKGADVSGMIDSDQPFQITSSIVLPLNENGHVPKGILTPPNIVFGGPPVI